MSLDVSSQQHSISTPRSISHSSPEMSPDPDTDFHCFSSVSLSNFKRTSISLCLRYILLLLRLGFSILLFSAEIFVSTNLLLSKNWTERVFERGLMETNFSSSSATINSISLATQTSPLSKEVLETISGVAGWIVLGSIGLNVCVAIWSWTQARSIIKSDSIPRAFLNSAAYRLWSIKSYAHFCLLSRINWGQSMRQRIVMAVYFGLQGFASALVRLPRLFVYGCILYAVRGIPDLAVSAKGFQSLELQGFGELEGYLLKSTLAAIALASLVHFLDLMRIMAAVVLCSCSLCYIRRILRAMDRDLKYRIMVLVISSCGQSHPTVSHSSFHQETKASKAISTYSIYECDVAKLSDCQSSSTLSRADKGAVVTYRQTEENVDGKESNNNFQGINLDAPADKVFTSVDMVSLENPGLRKGDFTGNSSTAPPTQPPRTNTTELLSTLENPTPESDRPIASSQPTWHTFHSSATTLSSLHAGLVTADMSVLSERRNLAPRNGLASLSFYDDLLKSISKERMMYASSLSNQRRIDPELRQFDGDIDRGESNNLPVNAPSIALCSPIPLSSISGNTYDQRNRADRPIHPFDMDIRHESSETLWQPQRHPMQENDLIVAGSDTNFHPGDNLDAKRRPGPTQLTKSHSQAYLPTVLNRSDSFHSQEEAIENWRIHVAPSSPPIMPELNNDRPSLQGEGTGGSTPPSAMRAGYVYDDDAIEQSHASCDTYGYPYEESGSRRGTIPIILSSHLHEAANNFQGEQDNYLSADDLHLPCPSYTYGQARTQRQGSVNSSIGGYNYSVASSPSLADSLSNSMYQQQSYGIMMNNSMFPRPMPGRKGSLPTSIFGSSREELGPRAHQASQPYAPHHLAYTGPATRVRARNPSHLSNMVNHWDDKFSHEDETSDGDDPHTSGRQTPPSIHKKSHFRSQSHGNRSSIQGSGCGLFKEAQAGYASLFDLPPSSMSRMMFQERSQDADIITGSRAIMTTANYGISYKEALGLVDPTLSHLSTNMNESQVMPTRLFDEEIVDRLVHPLDLSPLLLQPQTGDQRKYHDRPFAAAAHSTLDYTSNRKSSQSETQAAWNEACIGLGMTFSHENSTTFSSSAPRPEESPLRRPIPVRQPMHYSTNRNDYDQWGHERRDMILGMTFGTTTTTATTEPQDSATLTNPYQGYMTNYPVLDDYEKDGMMMTPPYHEPQRQELQEPQRQTSILTKERHSETGIQGFNAIHRQPSQRNKKNLIVNIVPLSNP